ncbi:MAG: VanZ family protein [Candidatus Moranbacteria bacterium]|nr:VanZ family protein [Candidatus Moranbacteria bacterium]
MAMSPFRCKARAWSVLLLWAGLVFALSAMPGGTPGSTMPLPLMLERKGAHVFEYFVFALLSFNAFRLTFPKERLRWYVLLSISLSLLYAFSDETHQLFVLNREGKLSDVGIDLIGIMAGVSIAVRFLRPRKR